MHTVIHTPRKSKQLVMQQVAIYGSENAVLEAAREICRKNIAGTDVMSAPGLVREYLKMNLATLPHEVFWAIWLDAQHRVVAADEMFRGTLTQTSVYPREVVKEGLRLNACAVIFAHNHPSGDTEPSRADEALTAALKQALALVDIRVLDHMIVGSEDRILSFAERGLL